MAAYLEGEYGINGLYMGVPAKLGSKGVEEIVEISLDERGARGACRNLPPRCRSSSASSASDLQQNRTMNLHEYQAKELLARFGVEVPRGTKVRLGWREAVEASRGARIPRRRQGADPRRRSGQGRRREARQDPRTRSRRSRDRSSGAKLVTAQTGPEGKEVRKLLIEEGLNIDEELYVSFLARSRRSGVPSASRAPPGAWTSRQVADETRRRSSAPRSIPPSGCGPTRRADLAFEPRARRETCTRKR